MVPSGGVLQVSNQIKVSAEAGGLGRLLVYYWVVRGWRQGWLSWVTVPLTWWLS